MTRETAPYLLTPDCVFCAIVSGEAPATIIRQWPDAIAITPLSPVTDGHALIIPREHVRDARDSPPVAAMAMRRAAQYMVDIGDANIITSVGAMATQTVFHLHVHVVPRREGDGLPLPWTPQEVAR